MCNHCGKEYCRCKAVILHTEECGCEVAATEVDGVTIADPFSIPCERHVAAVNEFEMGRS